MANGILFDGFGPEKVFEVYNAKAGMHGFVVIDNTALGPGKGGIRMTPSVSREEVFALARAMSWKNALAELPFGGAKSGIVADAKRLTPEKKDEIIRAFAEAVKPVVPSLYVAGPDISTTEHEMQVFSEAIGDRKACTGKPASMGGLPHELGSTGFGVFHATKIAAQHLGKRLNGMTFAVEGFGNVGWFASKFLTEAGAKLVSVSDSKGVLCDSAGIDFEALAKVKSETGSVVNYKPRHGNGCMDIVSAKADILITAAIPNLITATDVNAVNAKIIVEGSNIPMSVEMERILAGKGVLIVPDIVANAGGVISSYVEFIGGREKEMFALVEKKITKNTKTVLEHAASGKKLPRDAALEIAKERVLKACKTCKAD
ncbi:MAG: Glu/Leu/Phe/Val dehydrogenase [Candidatus Diapherotrites archaeon]|nr:Glu/Leu/Phe/Val dehydrogenase [Candidatus Diapherotrites archaeon]